MAPRTVLTEIAKVLEEHQATISGKYLYDFMQKIALEGNEPKVQEMIRDTIWKHLVHGALTTGIDLPPKIAV